MQKTIAAIVGCLFLYFAAPAQAITVGGTFGLHEWAGYYAAEDGVGRGGYVGPGYGGQAFDVEYLGLKIEGDQVYFGLQTGFNLKNGFDGLRPGDFALNVDTDPFYEYAIDYAIDGNTWVATYNLYQVTQWRNPIYSAHSVANPFEMKAGTQVATFTGKYGRGTYSNNRDGGTSYVLEGVFDGNLIGMEHGVPVTLHWTMECGNDYLNVTAVPTPEPATFMLMAGGLLGLVGVARKMRR